MQNYYLSKLLFHQNFSDLKHLIIIINIETYTLNSFKTVMLNYFLASLLISYNPNNPKTYRSICLKCTTVLPLSSKIT